MSINSHSPVSVKGAQKVHIAEDNDNTLTYELANIQGATMPEVVQILKSGGRFVIFYYRTAYLAVSFQRMSPATLIRNEEEFDFYRKKYNRKAFILGAFFVPFGPLLAFKERKLNNNGGLEVTGDILLNLTEEDLQKDQVIIRKMYTLFGEINKSDLKYFKKVLAKYGEKDPNITAIYVANYLNVDEYSEPPFSVGIVSKNAEEVDTEDMSKQLHTEFRSFVDFLYFDLNDLEIDEEIAKKFKSQGTLVYQQS